jgi:hypothetical protein
MILSPLRVTGNTVYLATNGTASTSLSCPITTNDVFGAGGGPSPRNVRILNLGTSLIWLSFTPASATAVVPTQGTTTPGTPQAVIPIYPLIVEVYTITFFPNASAGLGGLWVNSISAGSSQGFTLTFGEGA